MISSILCQRYCFSPVTEEKQIWFPSQFFHKITFFSKAIDMPGGSSYRDKSNHSVMFIFFKFLLLFFMCSKSEWLSRPFTRRKFFFPEWGEFGKVDEEAF